MFWQISVKKGSPLWIFRNFLAMKENGIQQQLFNFLKENIPPHLSLVDELGDLLQLSSDSVYRRIRGEKAIDLIELKKICEHYHISIDQLLQLPNESVVFNAPGLNDTPKKFEDYMKGVLDQFRYFNSFNTRKMFYLCKDAPIWYFYLLPELAAFKTFFWSKTINNQPDLSNKVFSFEEYPYHECFDIGQQVLEEHKKINSVELWNLESIHSTINQIAYYRDAGHFRSPEDLKTVVNSFHQWIDHLQLQTEKGMHVEFYVNELILGNNTMVIRLDDQSLSMVTYSVFYYLFTRDPRFSDKVMKTFDSLLSRSALISGTGEKERNRFFNTLRDKVNTLL